MTTEKMGWMPLSDINDLDAVVHALGIEDSDTTPAEAVAQLRADLAAERNERSEEHSYYEDMLEQREADLAARNDALAVQTVVVERMRKALETIENACNAPHWTTSRRWNIANMAQRARIDAALAPAVAGGEGVR